MSRVVVLVVLLAFGAGCGHDPETGRRYRAERELWNANREVRRLSIRPDLVQKEHWRSLAGSYEDIVQNHAPQHATDEGRNIRIISARALISAAQIQAAIGDSTQMTGNYARVEADFSDIPELAAEVTLAQGRIAESRRDFDKAIEAYRSVVENIEPRSGDAGVAGSVLELPLRMARLAAAQSSDSTIAARAPLYDQPRDYYRSVVEHSEYELTRLDARTYLAYIASDLSDWQTASRMLQQLEQEVLSSKSPTKDPSAIRLARANSLILGGASSDSGRIVLLSVVEEYPESRAAPQALFVLADLAVRAGQVEEALGFLDRIREDHSDSERLAAQALLRRGRILEREDRWTEAIEVFRSLPVEHPVSEPALLAPLEIANHYERVGDQEARTAALSRAERDYREFLARYPSGPPSLMAQERLAHTLFLQKRHDEAVTEFLRLGESLRDTPQGANFLLTAIGIAYNDLGDTARAVEILDLTASFYPEKQLGRWAIEEAARVRERLQQ
jgi:TolA-binding protein